jgi:hypothetical protein
MHVPKNYEMNWFHGAMGSRAIVAGVLE